MFIFLDDDDDNDDDDNSFLLLYNTTEFQVIVRLAKLLPTTAAHIAFQPSATHFQQGSICLAARDTSVELIMHGTTLCLDSEFPHEKGQCILNRYHIDCTFL